MKRRPPGPMVSAPERLRRFVASEWTAPPLPASGFVSDWMAEHWQHPGRFHAWRGARLSVGTQLEQSSLSQVSQPGEDEPSQVVLHALGQPDEAQGQVGPRVVVN